MDTVIKSPFNYTGGKHKLLKQLLPLFKKDVPHFIDLFCGGCNVGINVDAKKVTFIDYNDKLMGLINIIKETPTADLIKDIESAIIKYDLSQSTLHGYDYYNCNSADGLSHYNKQKYLKLREDYNNPSLIMSDYQRYIMLYVLIIFGFNNQIRFNKKGAFNIPVGKRDFNNSMRFNLENFSEAIKQGDYNLLNADFRHLDVAMFNDSFVYADPPYLITNASYNEQNGWNESCELSLYAFLDQLNNKNIPFALSNVLENKGKENVLLKEFINRNHYHVHIMAMHYNNANYQIKNRNHETVEVLVTNY